MAKRHLNPSLVGPKVYVLLHPTDLSGATGKRVKYTVFSHTQHPLFSEIQPQYKSNHSTNIYLKTIATLGSLSIFKGYDWRKYNVFKECHPTDETLVLSRFNILFEGNSFPCFVMNEISQQRTRI